jgi:hypothetical protein
MRNCFLRKSVSHSVPFDFYASQLYHVSAYTENYIIWFLLTRSIARHALPSPGVPFPKNFLSTCKTILRRLFRVYAHIYYEHFDQICALGIEGEYFSRSRSLDIVFGRVGKLMLA